jgi:SAM-dependent methyltransferase
MRLIRNRILSALENKSNKAVADDYINFVYGEIYQSFRDVYGELTGRAPGSVLELGAGSLSKSKEYFTKVVLSDGSSESHYGQDNEIVAESLPFANSQFDLVIAKDTLHHFNNVEKSLGEISRVLSPGGVFVVSEPYWSILGRIVFKFIHPERWITKPKSLNNYSADQHEANQAILLALMSKKYNYIIEKSGLSLKLVHSTYGISYLLSGGLNWRSGLSFNFLSNIYMFEKRHKWLLRNFTGLNIVAIFSKL